MSERTMVSELSERRVRAYAHNLLENQNGSSQLVCVIGSTFSKRLPVAGYVKPVLVRVKDLFHH